MVKALLKRQGLRPRKRWAQNFLVDRAALDEIADAANLEPGDRALEIGPGLGALTLRLAERCARVTAVELDRLLEPILAETLQGRDNVRLIFEDFLKLKIEPLLDAAFGDRPGVVVANIPYYITTPILERLLERKARIARIVLLVQQEFAERMAARPGTPECGAMSLFVQYHTRIELVGRVMRDAFMPSPDVDSAIVRLTPALPGTVEVADEKRFFGYIRAAFSQRRKTVHNALANGGVGLTRESAEAALINAGIDPMRRGETLSLEEFAKLARC